MSANLVEELNALDEFDGLHVYDGMWADGLVGGGGMREDGTFSHLEIDYDACDALRDELCGKDVVVTTDGQAAVLDPSRYRGTRWIPVVRSVQAAPTKKTVRDQLKGCKARTAKQEGSMFEGWGAFCGCSVELIDRNLNGHAVFEPLLTRDKIFLRLDEVITLHPAQ